MSNPADAGVRTVRRTPSTRDWAKHRDEMTRLYVQDRLELKEVIAYMQQRYGFNASPRQYQERFRQWKARKNITDAVRREMGEQRRHGNLDLTPDQARRIERQGRTYPDRRALSQARKSLSPGHDLTPSPNYSFSSTSQTGTSMPGSQGERSPANIGSGIGENPLVMPPAYPYPQSPNHNWEDLKTSVEARPPSLFVGGLSPGQLSISRSPSRAPTQNDNAEMIFFYVKQFCYRPTASPALSLNDDQVSTKISKDRVQRNLGNLKDIIYLYKIGDFEKAEHFLTNYMDLPFEIIVDQSVDFLQQLIATLAPINTTRKPAVRHQVLEHLHNQMKIHLGIWHPFTMICERLRLDNDDVETSLRALAVLQSSVMVWSRWMSFKSQISIISMMRREQKYDAAADKALHLIDSCSLVFGNDTYPMRKAMLELSFIYMAQQETQKALNICWDIQEGYKDTLSVRAMENLAEIHRQNGEMVSCVTWLDAAADLTVTKYGKSITTTHIIDKFFQSLRDTNSEDKEEKIRTYSKRYEEFL